LDMSFRFIIFSIIPLIMYFIFFWSAEVSAQSVLASSTTRHAFSDAFKNDYFKLTINGSRLIDADAAFEILDPNGRRIYLEEFTADMLLEPEKEGEELTNQQKEDYIKKRVNDFFKEDNFYRPAIDLTEEFDIDYNPDLKGWQLIRGDRTAIGFEYRIGISNTKRIAWVKNWKKMLIYRNE